MAIVQSIGKTLSSSIAVAEKYYSILSVVNNLGWAQKEIETLAFIAIRGVPKKGGDRELFAKMFNTNPKAVYNLVYRLYKMGLLVEEDGKRTLHPQLRMQFSPGIVLQIALKHE